MIGINNRDLKTFKVDLGTSERLIARARAEGQGTLCFVAESGIHTAEDSRRLSRAGAQAILVGESLMREADPSAKIEALIQAAA